MELHKYEVSNSVDEMSSQRYPIKIYTVKHMDFTSGKYPNGMLSISAEDVDGYLFTNVKCYVTKDGKRYGFFGKHRIYEGYSGGLRLIGVPEKHKECIRSLCKWTDTIVE